MRIALISPKGVSFGRFKEFQKFIQESKYFQTYSRSLSGLSSGLLIIASLTPSTYEIELIDENFEHIDFAKNYDLVGITAMSQQATRAYIIADKFKKRNIKVIIGGIHATLLPEEAKKHANSVVIGEAEYIWPLLLNDFKKGKLKPYYKSNKIVNLKDSPTPRYELLKHEYYKVIWVQTSRGCPHDCEFCAASKVYGRRYRHKSIEQVVNEIRLINNNFKNIQINFADDNFFINKKYSKKFLEDITSFNIRWNAQTDISIAENDELLDKMRKSGCFCLFIGLESLNKEGLKNIDKHGWKFRQFDNYSYHISKIQSYGIGVHGAFIIGLENDDSSVFQKISNFIIENNLYDAQITIYTPLPGTRLRERLEKENRLLQTRWENYTFIDVNFIHPKLTKEELENGVLEVYRKINSKAAYLKKMEHFIKIQKKLLRKI